MKSKSSMFILGILILAIVGAGVYFFVIKKDGDSSATGLVSTNTGATQGLQNTAAAQSATGSQVVAILRNLSVIKLDDSVFKNPAFALLTDVSISLPPITNQGRRNPFAPIGTDPMTPDPTTTSATGTTGPTF